MLKNDIIYRDNVLRGYLSRRNWDENSLLGGNPEFQLIRKIIKHQFDEGIINSFLINYPYIYDFEYETELENEKGKGDLIFADLKGNFLVVECKSIIYKSRRDKRTKGRKSLKEQLPKYVEYAKSIIPEALSVVGLGFTDMKTPFKLFCVSYFEDSPIMPDFNVRHLIIK